MSFFKEFKEDLSQAVNELVTEDSETKDKEPLSEPGEEAGEGLMINTLDSSGDGNKEPVQVSEDESHNIPGTSPSNSGQSEPVAADSLEMPPDNGESTDEKAEITKGTVIEGNISSEGSINLDGKVKGNVSCLGKLVISGEIVGASKAAEVYTNNSKISGDVTSEGSIKIGNGSVIIGNVFATSAVIGGAIKGDIDVKGPVILDNSAIVQGNIKSRSVQINNGAVIDGLVSQCYADVDFNTLFDDTFSK